MSVQKVSFSVLDECFELEVSAAKAGALEEAANYLKKTLADLQVKYPKLSEKRCALMAAVSICNDLVQIKNDVLTKNEPDRVALNEIQSQLLTINQKLNDVLTKET